MGQTAVQKPPLNLQKIVTAIAVVAAGHVGVLWLLTNMQPLELKKVEPTKPIQVRFVTIVEPPKPQPPKPKEPPKPKPVKIVEKPLPPKPVEKIKTVKAETPKPTPVQPVVEPKIETKVTTTVTKIEPTPQPTPQPTAQPVVQPSAPQVDTSTPRNLGDGATVAWKRKPQPKFVHSDLKNLSNDMILVRLNVDAKGKIKAEIRQGSGNSKVDREFLRAVQSAQFYPYTEDGVAVPFYADQSFRLK